MQWIMPGGRFVSGAGIMLANCVGAHNLANDGSGSHFQTKSVAASLPVYWSGPPT